MDLMLPNSSGRWSGNHFCPVTDHLMFCDLLLKLKQITSASSRSASADDDHRPTLPDNPSTSQFVDQGDAPA
jgi:hypothetical protein